MVTRRQSMTCCQPLKRVRIFFCVVIKGLKNVNTFRMHNKTCTFAAKPVNMLLKDFFSRFPDEESCVSYFKEIR